jgi:hypothetical protein
VGYANLPDDAGAATLPRDAASYVPVLAHPKPTTLSH